MKQLFSKKIFRWLNIILAVYIAGGVALFFLQEKILFHPEKLAASYKYQFDIPFKEINLKVNEEKTLSIIEFTVPDSIRKGVVLFFHGNRQNINRYAKYAPAFTKNNYAVWMIDYPGFGKSTGERTEQILYDDALLFYRMARANFSPDSILVYGKSLGSGIAAELASVRDCKRLILETPYFSLPSLMRHYLPIYPGMIMNYEFPTNKYFEKITAPVTIFHGDDDEIIPLKQSKRLLQLKQEAELIIIEKGTHNTLFDFPLYHQKLDSLLSL